MVVGEETRESILHFGFRNKRVSLFTSQSAATTICIEVYPARSSRFTLALFAMLSGTINPIPPSVLPVKRKTVLYRIRTEPFSVDTILTRRLSCSSHILQVRFPRGRGILSSDRDLSW